MRFACIFLISALISNTKLFCQEISLVDATINGDAHNTLANSAATKNSEEGITSQHEEGEAKELLLDKSAEVEIFSFTQLVYTLFYLNQFLVREYRAKLVLYMLSFLLRVI